MLDIQPLTYPPPNANLHFYPCDITSPSSLSTVAATIRSQLGHPTILINNAGIARGKTLLSSSEHDIRTTFSVNTLSHFWTVREFLPSMIRADHGAVVTVSSFAAWVAAPQMVDYAASKAAARAFHDGLAAELATRYAAPRVRTVLVAQGHVRTELFEGYRNDSRFLAPTLWPETVAEAVVRQVLSGESGEVVMPGVGNLFSGMGGWPLWLQHGLRVRYQRLMVGFRGRQVEGVYGKKEGEEKGEEEDGKGKGVEESVVMVSEVK